MRGQHGDRSMTKPMHVDEGGAKHDGRDQSDSQRQRRATEGRDRETNRQASRGCCNASRDLGGSEPGRPPGGSCQWHHPHICRASRCRLCRRSVHRSACGLARRLPGRSFAKPPAAPEKPLESGARDQHEPAYPRDHTRTCGAICAYVLGPMPSTSCNSSIRLNWPCCCRQVRIACAVTGPTLGSSSSCD